MRAQLFIKWFLSVFIISLLTLMILATIFPKAFDLVMEFLSQASSDIVSNQLSALITVSGAAPNYIRIDYSPTDKITYSVSSSNRRLTVKPNYNSPFLKSLESQTLYAVNLTDFSYSNVNDFIIEKKNENGKSVYSFFAR